MVEVCWLLDPEKCSDHGPGRTCTAPTQIYCWYKTEEAKDLLKRIHDMNDPKNMLKERKI
jgi:hypothetical protein